MFPVVTLAANLCSVGWVPVVSLQLIFNIQECWMFAQKEYSIFIFIGKALVTFHFVIYFIVSLLYKVALTSVNFCYRFLYKRHGARAKCF